MKTETESIPWKYVNLSRFFKKLIPKSTTEINRSWQNHKVCSSRYTFSESVWPVEINNAIGMSSTFLTRWQVLSTSCYNQETLRCFDDPSTTRTHVKFFTLFPFGKVSRVYSSKNRTQLVVLSKFIQSYRIKIYIRISCIQVVLDEFLYGFNSISLKLKEMYQVCRSEVVQSGRWLMDATDDYIGWKCRTRIGW